MSSAMKASSTSPPAKQSIQLTGMQFGLLEVLRFSRRRGKHFLWLCRCECGAEIEVQGSNLRNGHSTKCRSCGARKHGLSREPEHNVWSGMIHRCHNPDSKDYKNYGGRGIVVCDEWRSSFQAFIEHIGRRPSDKHSIDRIDNDGNYEPGNVHWATRIEQNNNKRNNIKRKAGETATLIR